MQEVEGLWSEFAGLVEDHMTWPEYECFSYHWLTPTDRTKWDAFLEALHNSNITIRKWSHESRIPDKPRDTSRILQAFFNARWPPALGYFY
jgi:hypothetical protein